MGVLCFRIFLILVVSSFFRSVCGGGFRFFTRDFFDIFVISRFFFFFSLVKFLVSRFGRVLLGFLIYFFLGFFIL